MSTLGNKTMEGTLSQSNRIIPGGWVIDFPPEVMPNLEKFEIYHGVVRGPGGYFLVYLGDTPYGVGQNGTLNEYAPNIPMLVVKGQGVQLHWSISTGSAPICTFYFRTPEQGII